MANRILRRRGTTAQHNTFTGGNGEITVDTDKKTLVVHDGTTAGGSALATTASVTTALAAQSAAQASAAASASVSIDLLFMAQGII